MPACKSQCAAMPYFCRVKLFWFIFAAYITLLPVTARCADACADELTCTEQTGHHEQQPGEEDDCSPFCVCNCCGTVNQPPFSVAAFIAVAKERPLQCGHVVARSIPFVYSDFWQPPRTV
jgi:hypothetical protein